MEPKPFKSVDDQIAILRFVGGRRKGEKRELRATFGVWRGDADILN